MPSIAFIDTEVDAETNRIIDIGCIRDNGTTFHERSVASFLKFISDADFLCGHNIIKHDLPALKRIAQDGLTKPVIDTLYLSPLLFPSRPYHALVKDDKINPDGPNDPFNDAQKARVLFHDEENEFNTLDENTRKCFYHLLHKQPEFSAFFTYVNYQPEYSEDTADIVRKVATGQICEHVQLEKLVNAYPVELAYSLSLILSRDRYSITPRWILKTFPEVDQVMKTLRTRPCLTGCTYCDNHLDAHLALKRFFGFGHFRTYADQPLQEKAVKAAINGSLCW